MSKMRITVMKRVAHNDPLEEHMNKEDFPQAFGPCEIFTEGQVFEFEGTFARRPDGFNCQGPGMISNGTWLR
ncbi:hypothetical protein KKG90_03595 [Candidatus Bipolaricaulota bacterium]|nr:hypothetical protein [Candidatus Bipolaricaulota bacterium]